MRHDQPDPRRPCGIAVIAELRQHDGQRRTGEIKQYGNCTQLAHDPEKHQTHPTAKRWPASAQATYAHRLRPSPPCTRENTPRDRMSRAARRRQPDMTRTESSSRRCRPATAPRSCRRSEWRERQQRKAPEEADAGARYPASSTAARPWHQSAERPRHLVRTEM